MGRDDTGGRGAAAIGLLGLILGCGSGSSGGGPAQEEVDWELISGDLFACPDPCTSNGAAQHMAQDFAFDGDDLLATAVFSGTRRLSLATMTWSEPLAFDVGALEVAPDAVFVKPPGLAYVTRFDRAGARAGLANDAAVDLSNTLRLSAAGKPLAGGTLVSDSFTFVLAELDPSSGPPLETPLPKFWGDKDKAFALDDQGLVWYDSPPADNVTSTVTILDRTAGTTKVVTYATPPADADGNVFPSFILGSALWGPVPGGGVLAVRQRARGSDLVRLMPDGTATFVVHADGNVGTILRLRIRDGYIYTAGYGLWRSKQRLF